VSTLAYAQRPAAFEAALAQATPEEAAEARQLIDARADARLVDIACGFPAVRRHDPSGFRRLLDRISDRDALRIAVAWDGLQTVKQLHDLTPDELRALSPDQLCRLTPHQLRQLTLQQTGHMTPEQREILEPIPAFRDALEQRLKEKYCPDAVLDDGVSGHWVETNVLVAGGGSFGERPPEFRGMTQRAVRRAARAWFARRRPAAASRVAPRGRQARPARRRVRAGAGGARAPDDPPRRLADLAAAAGLSYREASDAIRRLIDIHRRAAVEADGVEPETDDAPCSRCGRPLDVGGGRSPGRAWCRECQATRCREAYARRKGRDAG
jgi:hypothetical protein